MAAVIISPVAKEAEAAVLGACLSDPDAVIFAAQEISPADFAVPVHAWIASALWACFERRIAPTLAAVIDQLRIEGRWSDSVSKSAVSMPDLEAMLASITEADVEHVLSNARIVREAAFRRTGFVRVSQAAQLFNDLSLAAPDVQRGVLDRVGKVFDAHASRDAALYAIGDEERARIARMSGDTLPGVTCGLGWLDQLTGGLLPAEAWVIAAPYKMRKTTIMLNMILSAARAHAPVSVFTVGDSSRDATYRKLLAMVMNDLMIQHAIGADRHVVSSKTLHYPLRDAFYADLYAQASAWLEALPIRLYDGRDRIGGLSETARILRRDVAVHGTQVFAYDYVQAAACGINDYEKTSYYAGWCQQLIGELGIASISISQLNEDTIRSNSDSYSPGAKGGGALPAMANVFLTTRYEEPTITVELKLARDTRMGTKILHKLNPASGLILDANKSE
jgi:replicative DNA helicase